MENEEDYEKSYRETKKSKKSVSSNILIYIHFII